MNQKRFPEEFKIEAIRQIVERGHPVAEVSARRGVSTHSLYKWCWRRSNIDHLCRLNFDQGLLSAV